MRRFPILLVIIGLAVGACASREGRIREHQQLFDSYPAAVQSKIREGIVGVGFSEEMVRMALGDPDETSVTVNEYGETVVWGYTRSRPSVGLSLGGGGGGVGGGVGIGSGARRDYTALVEFQEGRVSEVQYFD